MNCGIYLNDSTVGNGCLWVIPSTQVRTAPARTDQPMRPFDQGLTSARFFRRSIGGSISRTSRAGATHRWPWAVRSFRHPYYILYGLSCTNAVIMTRVVYMTAPPMATHRASYPRGRCR